MDGSGWFGGKFKRNAIVTHAGHDTLDTVSMVGPSKRKTGTAISCVVVIGLPALIYEGHVRPRLSG